VGRADHDVADRGGQQEAHPDPDARGEALGAGAVGEQQRYEHHCQRGDQRHQHGVGPREDRRDRERHDQAKAERDPHQRQQTAQPRDEHGKSGQGDGQPEHRRAPIDVHEPVPGAGAGL
jgi:hypothetical protein